MKIGNVMDKALGINLEDCLNTVVRLLHLIKIKPSLYILDSYKLECKFCILSEV